MSAIVLLQLDASHDPGHLAEVLAERNRAHTVIARHQGETLPSLDSVRAVVVLGGAPADDDVRAFVAACVAAELPVLALGEGCTALGLGAAAADPALITLGVGDIAGDDFFEGLFDGQVVYCAAILTAPGDAHVLATHEGRPAAVRLGDNSYALAFEPVYDALRLPLEPSSGDSSDEEAAAAQAKRNRFIRPQSVALLGRWVDTVVGRDDSEAPWGRSGPPPESRPGLYLHPAN